MNKTEKGFSWVEGLLVLLVLAAVGFGGWYVMNRNTVDKVKPNTAAKSTGNSQQNKAEDGYVTITEWNVKFKLPAALKSMKYTPSGSGATAGVYLDSAELAKLAGSTKNCGDAGPALLGSLSRRSEDTALTSAVYLKKVGDYHYFYSGPQVACLPANANLSGDATRYPSRVLQETAADQLEATLALTLVATE